VIAKKNKEDEDKIWGKREEKEGRIEDARMDEGRRGCTSIANAVSTSK